MGRRLIEVVNAKYHVGVTVEVDEDERTGQFTFLSVKNVRSDNCHNMGELNRLEAGTLYQLVWDTYIHLRNKIDMDNKDLEKLRIQVAKPFALETQIDKLEDKLRASYPKADLVLPEEVRVRKVALVEPGEVADELEPLSGVYKRERDAMIADCAKKQLAIEEEKLEKHKSHLWQWRAQNIKQSKELLNLYCSMDKMPHQKLVFDSRWKGLPT